MTDLGRYVRFLYCIVIVLKRRVNDHLLYQDVATEANERTWGNDASFDRARLRGTYDAARHRWATIIDTNVVVIPRHDITAIPVKEVSNGFNRGKDT